MMSSRSALPNVIVRGNSCVQKRRLINPFVWILETDRETNQCVCVYFVGHDAYGARIDQRITLRAPGMGHVKLV